MKMFLFILTVGLTLFNAEWLTDLDRAKQIAQEENKMILLNFSGSDWCAPCIKMKKDVFDKAEFQEYASERLVLVRADFPRHKNNQPDAEQKARNEKLAGHYNPHGKFPLTLLLNPEGKVIREWDGFQGMSPGQFISQINSEIHAR
jgi:thioredoxin-related protein